MFDFFITLPVFLTFGLHLGKFSFGYRNNFSCKLIFVRKLSSTIQYLFNQINPNTEL